MTRAVADGGRAAYDRTCCELRTRSAVVNVKIDEGLGTASAQKVNQDNLLIAEISLT
jgi:hypothetical protein